MSLRRTVHALSLAIVYFAASAWFAVLAYADWLRFSSPRIPNVESGQVVYEKAVKGVFYITREQAVWTQYSMLPVWMTGVAAGLLVHLTRNRETAPHSATRDAALKVIGTVWFVAMGALVVFGDQVMSLIFAGTLAAPTAPAP